MLTGGHLVVDDQHPPAVEAAVDEQLRGRLYTIGAQVAVDHIARYEQLPTELERIAALLGLPAAALELPRANSGFRPDRYYSQLYTPQERDFVAELFADEIALHGYRYEELKGTPSSTPAC